MALCNTVTCGWTNSDSHHLETMVETIGCWYLRRGIIRNQGVLGAAKWISSVFASQKNTFQMEFARQPKRGELNSSRLFVFRVSSKGATAQMPSGHGKTGIPCWLVDFNGEPFPQKKGKRQHWATGCCKCYAESPANLTCICIYIYIAGPISRSGNA